MGKETETREDVNYAVLSQVWNKACAEEAKQGKKSPFFGLSKMRIQKQATRAEVRTYTASH
jgi:hypothetical protein